MPGSVGTMTPTEAQLYLESQSGLVPVLTEALAEICIERPTDPFQWLAAYLLKNNPNAPAKPAETHSLEGGAGNSAAPSHGDAIVTASAEPVTAPVATDNSIATHASEAIVVDAQRSGQKGSADATASDVIEPLQPPESVRDTAAERVETVASVPVNDAAAPIIAADEGVLPADGVAASSRSANDLQKMNGPVHSEHSASDADGQSATAVSAADEHVAMAGSTPAADVAATAASTDSAAISTSASAADERIIPHTEQIPNPSISSAPPTLAAASSESPAVVESLEQAHVAAIKREGASD
jgi:hypothetical protein